jgi:hypothetical protein
MVTGRRTLLGLSQACVYVEHRNAYFPSQVASVVAEKAESRFIMRTIIIIINLKGVCKPTYKRGVKRGELQAGRQGSAPEEG